MPSYPGQLRGLRALVVPNVLEIADASRAAAVAFLAGTGTGWGARDLAMWLAGPYRDATAAMAGHVRSKSVAPFGAHEEGTLERLLLSTREFVIDLLTLPNGWEESGFAPRAVAAALVVRVRDAKGSIGYAPVDHPRLALLDRIASLFFADFLTRPRDYEDLTLCEGCGELLFAWAPPHRRYCEAPPNKSEVMACSDRPKGRRHAVR